MSHPNFEAQLDAYLDGELAAIDARELEAHVAQCQECRRFRDNRLALRSAITTHVPAFRASDTLRQRVHAAAGKASAGGKSRFGAAVLWRSLALAASLAVVALGSWQLAGRRASGEALADEVFASHIRSLLPGHLTDVPSSDQHTVKPWFNGKLDYSPPVYDFAGRGYPLIGGRLDYVGGRPVAALVYGRRRHMINVELWPLARGATVGPATESRQGYHMLHWTTRDYAYWVVSDLGWSELREFAQLLQQADSAAS
jgi:anti-sigma factor RsiW